MGAAHRGVTSGSRSKVDVRHAIAALALVLRRRALRRRLRRRRRRRVARPAARRSSRQTRTVLRSRSTRTPTSNQWQQAEALLDDSLSRAQLVDELERAACSEHGSTWTRTSSRRSAPSSTSSGSASTTAARTSVVLTQPRGRREVRGAVREGRRRRSHASCSASVDGWTVLGRAQARSTRLRESDRRQARSTDDDGFKDGDREAARRRARACLRRRRARRCSSPRS